MARLDDLGLHILSAGKCRVEVVEFKPQQHAVSVWLKIWIPDGTVVVLHIPSVQLKNQPATRYEPLILGPAVRALTVKEPLIPVTARLDVAHANEGLWTHTHSVA
jgi:hypothetical protein